MSDSLAAVRAERKIRRNRPSAAWTPSLEFFRFNIHLSATVIKERMAVFTYKEWSPLLHREKWNKKKAQVMVHPFQVDLWLAADRTGPCLSQNSMDFRLNPADKEEKHSLAPLLQYFFLII